MQSTFSSNTQVSLTLSHRYDQPRFSRKLRKIIKKEKRKPHIRKTGIEIDDFGQMGLNCFQDSTTAMAKSISQFPTSPTKGPRLPSPLALNRTCILWSPRVYHYFHQRPILTIRSIFICLLSFLFLVPLFSGHVGFLEDMMLPIREVLEKTWFKQELTIYFWYSGG
ncbi:unnamed protein product [Lactuca saligna]|uniref:Uncharacterized protein n=1 Tax=Lactuca saligna TaxID=75948 RepID=A0AA36EMA9_LACSI|nr:unnamed protein product [Lactuca saligna]